MSSQKVCKFFLQGNCKHGDKCWYLHQNPKSGGGSFGAIGSDGGSGWRNNPNDKYHWQKREAGGVATHNRFDALSQEGGGGGDRVDRKEALEIIDSIKRDIEEWEKSHMWPLSSFAPRNTATLQGLEDYSPEELRFEAYRCQKEGKFQNYTKLTSQLLDAVKRKKRELKHPDPSLKSKLASFIMGNAQDGLFTASTSGGASSTASTNSSRSQPSFGTGFGSPQATTTGFGGFGSSQASGATASTTGFGGFGSTQASGPAATTTGFGGFGSTQASGPAATTTGFGGFGSTQASGTAATTTGFGGFGSTQASGPAADTTGFGGFGSTQASGAAAATAGFGEFGSTQASGPAAATTGFGGFGSTQASGPAATTGSAQAGNSFSFGSIGAKPKATATAPTASFGQSDAFSQKFGSQPTNKGLFGREGDQASHKPIDPNLYTPLSELTPEEREQFEAKHFTIGKIPERPPPIELI